MTFVNNAGLGDSNSVADDELDGVAGGVFGCGEYMVQDNGYMICSEYSDTKLNTYCQKFGADTNEPDWWTPAKKKK